MHGDAAITTAAGSAPDVPAGQPGTVAREYLRMHDFTGGGTPLPQRFKQYPRQPRRPLSWPPQPAPVTDTVGLLARVLTGYAPTRIRLSTATGMNVWLGRPYSVAPMVGEQTVRRMVASGGATYPAEVYAAVLGDASLPGGIYHYDPVHHALEELSTGDPGPWLRAALGREPAPVTLLVACRLWKNSSKYTGFGYRLGCVDIGVLAGELLAAGPVPGRIQFHFADRVLGERLGLDPDLEAVYAVVTPGIPAGFTAGRTSPRTAEPVAADAFGMMLDRALAGQAQPGAVRLHRASLHSTAGTSLRVAPQRLPWTGPATLRLPPPPPAAPARVPGVRRSAGRFGAAPVPVDALATVLLQLVDGFPSDLPDTAPRSVQLTAYCLLNRVDGVAAGAYRYDPHSHALVAVPGDDPSPGSSLSFRTDMGGTLRTPAASVFIFADPEPGLRVLGDRWYRILAMLAGIGVHRAAAAAAATGLGSRISFSYHPDRVRQLFRLPGSQVDLMHLHLGYTAPQAGIVDLALVPTTGSPR